MVNNETIKWLIMGIFHGLLEGKVETVYIP